MTSTNAPPNDGQMQWGSEQTERHLLATCLTSSAACEQALELLSPGDFFNPGWAGCFGAIHDLASINLPVDVSSVIEQMRLKGTLDAAGGEVAILNLLSTVTTGAVKGPIRIIQDYALRRRIRAMGSALSLMSSDPALNVDDLVGQVQRRTVEIELPDQSGEAQSLQNLMDAPVQEYDWVIQDLIERQDRTIVVAPEGWGKALAIDTPVPMADGSWKDMVEINVGDAVLTPGYKSTDVIAATEVMTGHSVALLCMDDGSEIVADLDHSWMIYTNRLYGRTVNIGGLASFTTWDILDSLNSSVVPPRLFLPDTDRVCDKGVRIVTVQMVPSVPVRCIQVASTEGMFLVGKNKIPTHNSTLLRQVAVMSAAGIHPFIPTRRIEPVRTLIIDLENRERSVRRQIQNIKDQASYTVDSKEWAEDRCHLWLAPGGIDLRRRADQARLAATVKQVQPDLITMGPLYKMISGDPRDEEVAMFLASLLEHISVRYNTALLIEAHAPHGGSGAQREMRPFGASLWQRWPEFGLGMYPQEDGSVQIKHWRGQREEREWPTQLDRGTSWPWIAVDQGARAYEA